MSAVAERLRLFLALDLPPGARGELVAWRDRAMAGRDELRMVPPEALHVTVAFLGDRGMEEVEEIARLTSAAVASKPAPRLRFGSVRGVPNRHPRLLALDLEDDDGGAADIAGAVEAALAGAGLLVPERRAFWAHVTVARVRRGGRSTPFGEAGPAGPPFRAGPLTLYRSRPGPGGSRYEALRRIDLG